jgi:hypothetical protein
MLAQQYPARPKCACPLLAQFGRHANDIVYQKDRQRLKAFIYRLAGSRDASAIDRRAHIIVNGIMRGVLDISPARGPDRWVTYLIWARAIFFLGIGWYSSATNVVLTGFAMHYQGQPRARREALVKVLCKTFDEALSAGREGQIDPAHAAVAMDRYERVTGAMLSI